MASIVTNLVKQTRPPASLEAAQKARDMKAAGCDMLSLATGQPDFPTPDHIKEAAYAAIKSNKTRYPPVQGIPELRQAICSKFREDNHLLYDPEQVIVSAGAKQVIFNALASSLDPGDEVLIPAPFWVSYPEMVRLNGGIPKIISTSKGNSFKLSKENLSKAITSKTKWLILNNPNNPTGTLLNAKDLQSLAQVLTDFPHVYIISDDIYEYIRYQDEPFYTIAEVSEDIKNRTLTVNGFSKSYCMTGWRIGYGAGPIELVNAMRIYQSQSTGGVMLPSQWAGLAAIKGQRDFMEHQLEAYLDRRDMTVRLINKIKGLECTCPQGAFYVYVGCKQLIGMHQPDGQAIKNDKQLTNYLVNQARVVTVPGEAFGFSPFFRISYATSLDIIEKACEALNQAISMLKP